jgi:hypothetical protein
VSSPERVYALLVEANPIPDPRSVPPVPSPADERRRVMLTREPTETKLVTAGHRWPRAVAAFAATLAVIGAVVVAWVIVDDGGPVAAGDARIAVTFTGGGVSYDGPREIIAGSAEVQFNNEAGWPSWLVIARFDTGSAELADELDFIREGGSAVLPDDRPMPSELEVWETFGSGANPVEITFRPGTYVIDTGMTQTAWRAAVIEVVAG